MLKTIENLQKYVLYLLLGGLAVFILFNNTSPFVISKEILLITGVCLIILLWIVKMFIQGSLSFHIGKFDLGVALLALTYLVSTYFRTPNKMEAFLIPGTTTFILSAALLYFLINQFDSAVKYGGKVAIFISAIILSLTSLLSALNLFAKIPQLPPAVKDVSFNLMGGAIPSVVFLTTVIIFAVALLINQKDSTKKALIGFGIGIILFALTILVISSLPGRTTSPRFLRSSDSWEVAIETLKKSPLIGVGPANYLTAFNLFKPLTYNQTDLWQVRFTTASNFYFTLLTETGFLGLFALSILLISVYKFVKKDLKMNPEAGHLETNLQKFSLAVMLVLFALLPITPLLVAYLFILLALFSESEHKTFRLNIAANESGSLVSSRIPVIIVGLPFVVAIAALMFFGIKVLRAESTFTRAVNFLGKNDAKATYDSMNNAIRINPKVDRYHASFAQVNMALATSLASKKEVTETDRTAITQLVQQAIGEGKATVALNPGRSGNWEVLAQIYRSIMPFAQGADQFAVQTYTQAIALDPTNPNLRIALGGVYYSLGAFDPAIEAFKLAVLAKPDLANARYNLAIAYREKKDYDNAIAEMNNVLKLVKSDSQDYSVAKQALEDLQSKKKAAAPAQNSENLTAPTAQQPSNVNPPIDLPNESTPPAAPNN